jgi:hydroxymethylglutaryl-CoA reductase (NADPH)
MSKASTVASKASKPSKARTRDQLVQALVAGEIGFHELPRDLAPEVQAEIRRQALERLTGADLEDIGQFSLDSNRAALRNCENFIGVAQVPMGVVGPLHVRGDHIDEEVYVPLATTEAALVASTNRGCSAIRAAGGARVHVEDVGMTRAPVFRTAGLDATRKFVGWVEERIDEIRRIAEKTSRHLKLLDVRPKSFGTTVLLRFRFASGDAMGMNMATIACDRIVRELIEPETGIECVALSGNYCVDKKPAAINFHEGRGKRIFAEVILEAAVLRRILKTTARTLVEVQYRKNLLGSIAAGAVGFNAHYANLLAALFIATGQDPAHVVEGSLGITCIEAFGPEAVYASVYMPAVPIGCVGGGTDLDTQRQALDMLGIRADPTQPGKAALRLAEIFGATVLAGEMSLMAAFTSQDLASAHEKLGRGNASPDDRSGRG